MRMQQPQTHPAAWACLAWLLLVPLSGAAQPVTVEVDFAESNGVFRALHGINKGPLVAGGLIDLAEEQTSLGIPFTRLHDCHWPNPDVVDIHAVFPDFRADPERAESYDFVLTDEYLAAIRNVGAKIVYRLGESIEHGTKKRFVHPPADAEKWAKVCLGIIRHYNEGWADGFRHGIQYWEIWNEPENRPAMWTGTDDQFLGLYKTAARVIKARYPELKVGGPAFGYSGQFVKEEFQPSDLVTNFLALCRRESVPLDFFSWHCYTAELNELSARARAIRRLLDVNGFAGTESHLNEWNFLPGNTWKPLSKFSPASTRQFFYEQMGGAPGAAFIAAALIELQEAPVQVCNLFHGEAGGFGLFTEHGVPMKSYYAVRAFRELLDTGQRCGVSGAISGQFAASAGLTADKAKAVILLSNFAHPMREFRVVLKNLPSIEKRAIEIRRVDEMHTWELNRQEANAALSGLTVKLKSPSLCLITLTR
jgi:xylan 1,4-beta-xylosidase